MSEPNREWVEHLAPSKEDLPEGAVGWVAYIEKVVESGRFNEDGTYTPAKKRLVEIARKRFDGPTKGDG